MKPPLGLLTVSTLLLILTACDLAEEDSYTIPQHFGSRTFWDLPDNARLTAEIASWPPKPGTNALVVRISPDDYGQAFEGRLGYRVVSAGANAGGNFTPIPRTGQDPDGTAFFEASPRLPVGDIVVQFDVMDANFEKPVQLTNWEMTVE